MTKSYLRSTPLVRHLTPGGRCMKAKFLKVAGILMIFAASGLADFPVSLLTGPKCC